MGGVLLLLLLSSWGPCGLPSCLVLDLYRCFGVRRMFAYICYMAWLVVLAGARGH